MSFVESAKGQTDTTQLYWENEFNWEGAKSCSPSQSLQNRVLKMDFNFLPGYLRPGVFRRRLDQAGVLDPNGQYKYHFLYIHEKKRLKCPL